MDLKPTFISPDNPSQLREPRADDTFINEPDVSFDTISDLTDYKIDQSPRTKTANVIGYYSAGDGGGGTFYWDSSEDKANHNGGTVINPSHNSTIGSNNWYSSTGDSTDTSGSGCWVRPINNFVFVEWFGAVDDNSTISSKAFQEAVNNSKNVTTNREGTFLFDNQVRITTADTTLDLRQCTCKTQNQSDTSLFRIEANNSKIKNGYLDGNRANQTQSLLYGIRIEASDDCSVENINIKNIKGYGISVRDSQRTKIYDNTIKNTEYLSILFIIANSTQNLDGPIIKGNYVDREDLGSTVNEGGIKVLQSGGSVGQYKYDNFLISDNVVIFDSSDGGECFSCSGISGRFTNNYGYGGRIGVTIIGEGHTCSNNIFENQNQYGIEYTRVDGLSITSNVVEGNNNLNFGIAQTNSNQGGNDVSVSSNYVKNCTTHNYAIENSNNTSVIGNTSVGGSVIIETSEKIIFSSNSISDGGSSIGTALSLPDQENIIVSENIFDIPNSSVAIEFSSNDDTFIPNNIVITNNYFNNSGSTINTNLASGSIGNNWTVKNNTGPSTPKDYIDYKNDVIIRAFDKDPNGWGGDPIGSLTIDYTNGKLYINTDGTSTGWVVVGTQS